MRPLVFCCLFVFALISSVLANQEQFETANRLYNEEHFDSAISVYQTIIQSADPAFGVYYNLGNAYYKKGAIAKAILNYERAVKIEPKHADVNHNLALARAQVSSQIVPVPQIPPVRLWQYLTQRFSVGFWATFSIILAFVVGGLFLGYAFLRRRSLLYSGFVVFGCLCLTVTIANATSLQTQRDFEIVTASNVYVKSAPDNKSKDLFILYAGVKFETLETIGKWKKIELADGKIGWIPLGYSTVI